ncbi:MAG: hypothetical protein VYC09_06825 [Verrucomicrobiota bacterium]|nr:hypothetical protein [Verrucomicrobiota bacterium]
MSEPLRNVPSSAEPRTVPPSPGHITQLGTSDVPCENTLPVIAMSVKNRIVFIFHKVSPNH